MDCVSVDELDATGDNVLDALLDLPGPCLLLFGIERLVHETFIDLVGQVVTIFPGEGQDLVA